MIKINARGVRYKKEVKELPAFTELRFIGRYIHVDGAGEFEGVQYALYFPNATYTADLTTLEEVEEFQAYLKREIAAAGIKPKVATGTIQAWDNTNTVGEEACDADIFRGQSDKF